ncbi:MAG: hypothetical protein HQL30_04685 [Candidatus Omnitrophica bacterium]|nr:hypothetical protein [Candidatus Omnitrophota bacterium]
MTFAIILSVVCFLWALFVTMKLTSASHSFIPTVDLKKLKQDREHSNTLLARRDQEVERLKSEIKMLKDDIYLQSLTSRKTVPGQKNEPEKDVKGAVLDEAEKNTRRLKEIASSLEARNEEVREKEKANAALAQKVEELSKTLSNVMAGKDITGTITHELNNLRDDLKNKDERIQALSGELAKAERVLSGGEGAQKEYADMARRFETVEKERDELDRILRSRNDELEDLSVKLSESAGAKVLSKQEMVELAASKSQAEKLLAELEEEKTRSREKDIEIDRLTEEASSRRAAEPEINRMKEEIARLTSQKEFPETSGSETGSMGARIDALEHELRSKKNENAALRRETEILKSEVSKGAAALEGKTRECAEALKKIESLEAEAGRGIGKAGKDRDEIIKLNEAIVKLTGEKAALEESSKERDLLREKGDLLERDIAEKEKDLEAKSREIEVLKIDKDEALREKDELGSRIVESDNLWERLRSSESELGARAAETESLRERLSAAEEALGIKGREIESLARFKLEAAKDKEELGARTWEVESLREMLRVSGEDLGTRAAELVSLREKLSAAEEALGAKSRELDVLSRSNAETVIEKEALGAKVSELENLRGELRAAENEIESKGREVEALLMSNAEAVREKDELGAKLAELEELKARLKAAETELRSKVEGFASMAEDADRMREKIDTIQNELWMKETESSFRLEEMDRLNREIANAEAEKEAYREKAEEESASRITETQRLKNELENALKEKEGYRERSETAGETIKRLEGIENEYRSKEEESVARLEEIGRLNSEISEALREKEDYRTKAEELEDVKAKLKEAENFLAGKDGEIAFALGEIDRLNLEIERERARIVSLEENSRREAETFSARVDAIGAELSSAKQGAAMDKSEIGRLKAELDDAIIAQKGFEAMELSVREDLGKRISSLESELEARSSEIERLNERAAGLDSTISALAAEKKELERKTRDIDSLVQRIGSMERDLKIKQEVSIGQYDEIDRLKTELAGVLSEKTALESRAYEADVLCAKVSSLEDELERRREEAERLNLDISGLSAELSSMAALKDSLRAERVKAEESDRRADRLTEELLSKEKESDMRQTQIAYLHTELAAISEKNAAGAKESGFLRDRIKNLESELVMKGDADREREREREEIKSVYDIEMKKLSLEVESLYVERKNAEQLKKEMAEIRSQLNDVRNRLLERDEEIRGKQLEVQVLNSELLRAQDEKKKIGDAVREKEELKTRLDAVRSDIFAKDKALAEKQAELDSLRLEAGKLSEDTKRYDINMDKVKVLELSLVQMEHSIEEQRRISGNIKSRLEKSREKIAVLNNKTRDNIEAIAEFAGTREFMELRRSVYIDELVKRYEREINDLRTQLSSVKRTSVE